jgi:hypothetical protein
MFILVVYTIIWFLWHDHRKGREISFATLQHVRPGKSQTLPTPDSPLLAFLLQERIASPPGGRYQRLGL